MKKTTVDIVMVTNSPGELFSWVRVVSLELKAKNPDLRIIISLVPCPYATGKEKEVAGKFLPADFILEPGDYLNFVIFGKLPDGYKPSKKGIIVFLGGDFWHAVLLQKRLGYPCISYVQRAYSGFIKNFKYFCCPDEDVRKDLINKKKVPPEKIKVVGNLMVDGAKPSISKEEGYKKWNLDPEKFTVGIFPGSRLYNMQDALPVMLKAAGEIRDFEPETQFLLGISPFRTIKEVDACIKNPHPPIPGVKGEILESGGRIEVITENGLKIPLLQSNQYDLMNLSDLIITIPGTNTAESASLGKPSVVISSWRARVPKQGIGRIINLLPQGKIRRKIMMKIFEKLKFTALPNIFSGRYVVPEVIVEEKASEITDVAVDLMRNPQKREEMSRELKGIMGEPGASSKISDIIIEMLDEMENK